MNHFPDKNELMKYTAKLMTDIVDEERENCLAKDIDQTIIKQLEKFPNSEETMEDIYREITEYIIPYCTDFHNPRFMGFPDAGNSPAGLFGAIASDLLQQNLINATFCSPIATRVEMAVIQWLREIVGYKANEISSIQNVGGIVTTGGTMSNTIAMLLARVRRFPESYSRGITDPELFGVVIPKGIDHYSITSSLYWIGCGNQTIEVETKGYRYDLSRLRAVLEAKKGAVMCVVVYAGDSRTMTIEKIAAVYEVVKSVDETIWVHVDACNGFCLSFNQQLKRKLKGIEMCDSISLDPHKTMMLPYTASVLLVKNPQDLMMIRTKSDLIMVDSLSFGQVTPFLGSKSWLSLKIWCVMKYYGVHKLGEMVGRLHELAQYLKCRLESSSSFKVLNEVDGLSVVFMYIPEDSSLSVVQLNGIQKGIHAEILKEKKYYLHQFPIVDQLGAVSPNEVVYPLRFFSGNQLLTRSSIDEMVDYVLEKGERIYENGLS